LTVAVIEQLRLLDPLAVMMTVLAAAGIAVRAMKPPATNDAATAAFTVVRNILRLAAAEPLGTAANDRFFI
jgi:hypothetical protein